MYNVLIYPDPSIYTELRACMTAPILSIVGKSGCGKTTLIEKIIPELKRHGYRVATVKHHYHPGFEIDLPGKDTWRFARAGSDCVILAAPDKVAKIVNTKHELSLDEIAASIENVEVILTEGFKRAGKSAIEVVRQETGVELISQPPQLVAVVTDTPFDIDLPQYALEDIAGIVAFIEAFCQSNP